MAAQTVFGRRFVNNFNTFGRKLGNTLGSAGAFGRQVSTVASKVIDPLVNLNNQIQKDPTTRTLAGLVPGYSQASQLLNIAKAGNDTLRKVSDTTSGVGQNVSQNNYSGAIKTIANNI